MLSTTRLTKAAAAAASTAALLTGVLVLGQTSPAGAATSVPHVSVSKVDGLATMTTRSLRSDAYHQTYQVFTTNGATVSRLDAPVPQRIEVRYLLQESAGGMTWKTVDEVRRTTTIAGSESVDLNSHTFVPKPTYDQWVYHRILFLVRWFDANTDEEIGRVTVQPTQRTDMVCEEFTVRCDVDAAGRLKTYLASPVTSNTAWSSQWQTTGSFGAEPGGPLISTTGATVGRVSSLTSSAQRVETSYVLQRRLADDAPWESIREVTNTAVVDGSATANMGYKHFWDAGRFVNQWASYRIVFDIVWRDAVTDQEIAHTLLARTTQADVGIQGSQPHATWRLRDGWVDLFVEDTAAY